MSIKKYFVIFFLMFGVNLYSAVSFFMNSIENKNGDNVLAFKVSGKFCGKTMIELHGKTVYWIKPINSRKQMLIIGGGDIAVVNLEEATEDYRIAIFDLSDPCRPIINLNAGEKLAEMLKSTKKDLDSNLFRVVSGKGRTLTIDYDASSRDSFEIVINLLPDGTFGIVSISRD